MQEFKPELPRPHSCPIPHADPRSCSNPDPDPDPDPSSPDPPDPTSPPVWFYRGNVELNEKYIFVINYFIN